MPKEKITSFNNATTTSLKGTSFVRANSQAKQRIILAIDAMEKCGKTHFALTAPGPIAYINNDMGLDGVVQKFQKEKEIWVASYKLSSSINGLSVEKTAELAGAMWEKFTSDYMGAVNDPQIKTVVLDTATEVWDLLRLANFGKLKQVNKFEYDVPQSIFREMIRLAEDTNKNFVFIHKVKDEWVNDKSTGNKKRAGFAGTGYLVQANARLWKNNEDGFPDKFKITLTDCRQNPEAEDVELSGEAANFSTVAQLVFPDSEPGDWE